jgi:capsular exopolysaccharide synthesis family protein
MSATPDLRFEGERERDSIGYALAVLRRRWLVVFACVALCLAAGVVISGIGSDKRYESSTRVLFNSGSLSSAGLQVDRSTNDPERDAATNVLLAGSEAVAANVKRDLGLSTSVGDLQGKVDVEAEPNANVIKITASDGDPDQAAAIANAFAKEFIDFRAKGDRESIDQAERDLQAQMNTLPEDAIQQRSDLRDSLNRLASLRAVATGDARVIARAEPSSDPAGLGLKQTLIFAAILGLALGLVGALVVESMDKRIADVASFEREYRLRALAVIPQKAFRRHGPRSGSASEDLEPFRILRTAVDFAQVTRPVRTVMVTSAVRGEGKTSVAIGLAQAIALSGRPVILVELDLRHPTLARAFRVSDQNGVTSALLGSEPNELLQRPMSELPNLELLAAGVLPPNPAELLEAPALDVMLRALLQDGRKTLVIDAAPLLPVADAQILLNKPAVDASVVVARQGVTTRDHARRARLVLEGHQAAPIGLVVTGHAGRDAYGYGYGEVWQPGASAEDGARSEPVPTPMPVPAPHAQPPRERTRGRTRLSWLR